MKEFEKVGTIVIGKTVDVTDPCYDADVWCRATIKDMEPGTYGCYFSREKSGKRVSCCRIVLESGEFTEETAARVKVGRSWRSIIDAIGVDAGLAGFFSEKPDFNGNEWRDLCDKMFHGGPIAVGTRISKDAFPDAFLASKENGTAFPNGSDGFWTSSGWGDGGYPVYAMRNNKRHIVALEIRFL